MGLLFQNWLDEGYYQKDDYDSFTKLNSFKEIYEAFESNTLYQNDGLSTTQVTNRIEIDFPIPPEL